MTRTNALHVHLTAWRKHRGLSQEHVANILGVDKSTIHRWETGKRAVDLSDLQRLADIYEVDPVALLLAPGDLALAKRLQTAKAILEHAPAEVADRWLALGADASGMTLPELQHDP